MSRPASRRLNFFRPLAGLFGAALTSGMIGCGSAPAPAAALSPAELLDILDDDLKRNDPQHFVEVELGKFKVSHNVRATDKAVMVKFHLFAVLPESRSEDFQRATAKFDKRIRDSVISIIQQSETERLTDAGLSSLKGEIIASINRLTRTRVLKDVVFSDFSLDRT